MTKATRRKHKKETWAERVKKYANKLKYSKSKIRKLNLGPTFNITRKERLYCDNIPGEPYKSVPLHKKRAYFYQWRLWQATAIGINKDIAGSIYYSLEDNCPSCDAEDSDCHRCISAEVWFTGTNGEIESEGDCCDTGSAFDMWTGGKDYDGCFFAQLIADESKRLLMENL